MKISLFQFLLLVVVSLANAQTTLVLQPGSNTGKDSEVSNYSANLNNNYGNYGVISSYVWTNGSDTFSERALLQFDLSSIPAGATITSAYLDLWASPPGNTFGSVLPSMNGTNNASYLQRITQPWDQNTVTWNNQPGATNSNQIVLPTSTSSSENYLNINVTQLVQDMLSFGNNGFMISPVSPVADNSMLFNSSNFSDTTLSPRLTVVYSSCTANTLALGNDTALCNGQTMLLNATNPHSTYKWQDNSNSSTYHVSAGGNYSVTVTDSLGCSINASVKVDYTFTAPGVNLGSDEKICADSALLNPGGGIAAYQWSDGSTNSSLTIFTSGLYSVTASNGCGTASSQINIDLLKDQCALLIPTGFSPNNDGRNDLFRAISYCPVNSFSIRIINRWGEVVYQSNDINVGWDGTFKERAQPVGVYVYYIEYFNYCKGAMDKRSGNVTLLR